MKVMLPKKNKRNVIILSILAFVFLASGIFLLWRVNQEKELSPDYSEAGGSNAGCAPGYTCSGPCTDCRQKCYNKGESESCGTIVCGGGGLCPCNSGWRFFCPLSGSCEEACGDKGKETPVTKCSCAGGYGNSCGINCKFPSDTQSKVNAAARSSCEAKVAMCNGSTGEITIENYTPNHPCYGKLSECKNPYAPNPCTPTPPPPPPPEPVCDGGNWDTNGKPSGVYPYCSDINYSFVAKDSDGVNKSSVVVKVNEDVRVSASKNTLKTGDTEVRVKETLSTETNCLQPGDYTISAVWKDVKGAGGAGTACALTTSFTVAEEIKNPNWNITKIPVESCIDDNTENPKAKLEYVITIENTGEGSGEIASIVDTLDSKVLQEYIEEISSNGEFSGGKISWTLTGTEGDFAPGQSKTYTYSFTVPKEAFGTYDNTVEAVPSAGSSLVANASIIADCIIQEPENPEEEPETPPEEPLPGTGIFDDTQGSLILGFVLLILGFTWRIIGNNTLLLVNNALDLKKKASKEREWKRSKERKKNFERKVVKD